MPKYKTKGNTNKDKGKLSLDKSEYEKLGRAIEEVVVSGYVGKRRLFGMNFLRGLFFGFGSTIGATLLILVIVYTLSAFSELPFIGNLFESIRTTIEESTSSTP